MKLKAVRGEIVPAAFAEYKISQGTRRHLSRKNKVMIVDTEMEMMTNLLRDQQTSLEEKDQDDDERRASTGDDDDAMTG